MKKDYSIETIENYINHKLDATEIAAFEAQMNADPALAAEVNFHKDILLGIDLNGEENLKNVFSDVAAEMEQEGFFKEEISTKVTTTKEEAPVLQLFSLRNLSIAASFALLVTLGWWLFNQSSSPEQIFATNYEVPKDLLSERLGDVGFGLDRERMESLEKGMKAYQQKDYAKAISILKSYSVEKRDNWSNDADFYLAMSFLETNEIAKAQQLLTSVSQQKDFKRRTDAKWYLALSYIKQNQSEKAKGLLQELTNDTAYRNKATKVLKQL